MKPFESMMAGEIEHAVDRGVRHEAGAKPEDYLRSFLETSRRFGFATRDDSWGEFEKEFSIMVRRLVVAERTLADERANREADDAKVREAFLAFFADARKFEENVDGDEQDGRTIVSIDYDLSVDHDVLAAFCEALGIPRRFDETAKSAIEAELAK